MKEKTSQQYVTGNDAKRIADKVSRTSLAVNIGLAVIKFIAGVLAHSGAVISDAVHTASDVFSTVIVIIGFHISSKSADKEHPYGHERLECAASIVLAVVLCITGLSIGKSALEDIFYSDGAYTETGALALAAAAVSIIVKEWMYHYTAHAANKINSPALKADAWHHRSDALSSIGALIGVGGAMLGFPILEPIASLVICLLILKAAVDIFKDSVDKMVDKACDDDTADAMRQTIENQSGVESLVNLRTRMFGARIYVDAVIAADGTLTLAQAHDIARAVHDNIESQFPMVKHCMVHVDPV